MKVQKSIRFHFHHDKNIWNVRDDWVWQDAINISKNVKTKTLIIGGNVEKGAVLNKEIAKKVKKNIYYHEIKSLHGHDAFLIESQSMEQILSKIF